MSDNIPDWFSNSAFTGVSSTDEKAEEKIEQVVNDGLKTCDSCENKQKELNRHGKMYLCDTCHTKEKSIPAPIAAPAVPVINPEPTNPVVELITEIAVDNAIRVREDFFNAETTALVNLEKEILADDSIAADQKYWELVKRIREQYQHYRKILFQVREVELEHTTKQRAQQNFLNNLAARIRKEERDKLKLEHIEYQPESAVEKKPKAPRISAEDKQLAMYAKVMKVSIEQARHLIANSLKAAQEMSGAKCSCAETPGLCKVHPKG